MSKPLILVCDGMDKIIFDELKAASELNVYEKAKCTKEEIEKLLPEVEGLIIRSATCPDQAFLNKATKLKYIIRAGEGVDNIDLHCCLEKGIKVSNTPGANNNSAAEHALALMMTVMRKTAWANAKMQKGIWDKNSFTGNELWKKTIGIMGFGRIGQLLCKRLQGFEPNVLFFDPSSKNSAFDYAKKVDSLEELFSKSEIISIHTPLMEQTQGIVNFDLLSKMRSDAVLINCARGKIVDENALAEVLKNKKIKGAGFDVFATEPLTSDSPLLGLDNLILTPHLGGSTEEAQFRVGEMAAHQMKEFFINNNLLNEVKAK